jgi:Uma2 family endonuclease
MVQGLVKPIGFDAFADWYPEDSLGRYELRSGYIFELPRPTGKHSEVAGELMAELFGAIDQAKLSCFIPRYCMVKVSDNTGYDPDLVVVDKTVLGLEPRWECCATVELAGSIKLIVEVVGENWRDDYHRKMAGYEEMGVPEYWIADYLGLGAVRLIGSPKQPTLTICTLVDGEYEVRLFRGGDRIISPLFPDLELTAAQVLLLE